MQNKTIVVALRVLQTHFPSFFKDKTETDKKIMIAVWSEAFRNEYDDGRLIRAIVRLCANEEFFPTLAKVREYYKRQEFVDISLEAQGKLSGGVDKLLLGTGGTDNA